MEKKPKKNQGYQIKQRNQLIPRKPKEAKKAKKATKAKKPKKPKKLIKPNVPVIIQEDASSIVRNSRKLKKPKKPETIFLLYQMDL